MRRAVVPVVLALSFVSVASSTGRVAHTLDHGTPANGSSSNPAMSADAKVVVFEASAGNLVAGDTNNTWDIFVRDRERGVTERVSPDGVGPQSPRDFTNLHPAISGDGRFVAYDAGFTVPSLRRDVYLHDRLNRTTEVVGLGAVYPSLSFDGRLVALVLIPGGAVLVHDRVTRSTETLTLGLGGQPANGFSSDPRISADGRFVAFSSSASNLVPGDTNGGPTGSATDVFVHDRVTRVTERVSVADREEQANGVSASPAISHDGRFVAFVSGATNLVTGDTNEAFDIFLRDRRLGTTERIDVSTAGAQTSTGSFNGSPSVSGDGRFVTFISGDETLVPNDTNERPDVFLRDRQRRVTERLSLSSDGAQGSRFGAIGPAPVSADGRFAAFGSWASNLVAGTGDVGGIFVRDRQRRATELASVSTGTAPTAGLPPRSVSIRLRPHIPRRGALLTVIVPVTVGQERIERASVKCRAKVDGKRLAALSATFRASTARCVWRAPRKGRMMSGLVSATTTGGTATATFGHPLTPRR